MSLFLSANLYYKEVTILICCFSADQSDGRRCSITATSKTGLLCLCQCTHWTEHCSCSVLMQHFHFFKKPHTDFIFCQEKFERIAKLLPEDNIITSVLIEWLLLLLEKIKVSKTCQKLAYLNLHLCKLDTAL